MARPKKFKSAKALGTAWEEYKAYCDNQTVLTHGFSAKNSEFVSAKLGHKITYTIEGFCAWAGLNRQAFYATYANDPDYCDIVTRMKEECEVDARMKFELGEIDPKLAPLWMSKYGYSTKEQAAVSGGENQAPDDPITTALKEAAKDGVQ